MTGRERLLAAINNQKPDRLPCQVHSWMPYYLKTFLNGMDQYSAYEYFSMDPVIYTEPNYIYSEQDQSKWQIEIVDMGTKDGIKTWRENIITPKGMLTQVWQRDKYTQWTTEHLIKTENDFIAWDQYVPIPVKVDWQPVIKAKEILGDKGIVRGCFFDFGQGSPWQSLCTFMGIQKTIMAAIDNPEWVEYMQGRMLQKKLKVIEISGNIELDLVETGGGAGSSTVISPEMHKKFCLPYDCIQHAALHDAGTKVVYHLCGGIMPLLDIVVQNGTDGLETMTPKEMGGDCDLRKCTSMVGDKLFFIGGFDQNKGFENGTPAMAREIVKDLFKSCPDGGYICSPSDHFFFGEPENIFAFSEAVKECVY